MNAANAPVCPKCSGAPETVEATTATTRDAPVTVRLRCACGVAWAAEVAAVVAVEVLQRAIRVHPWVGTLHAQLGLLLEITGDGAHAYEAHAVALRCDDAFDRAFCHERRGAFEARHGWLRNAWTSFREALAIDHTVGGAREATYRDALAFIAAQLGARGIAVPPEGTVRTDRSWLRACELEKPPGHGDRNELGAPLADDVIEVERLVRAERWDAAIAALRALRHADAAKLVDAVGYAARAVALAGEAGRGEVAIALQELVVEATVIWASWSTSGAEGMARTAEVERERARLRALREAP